MTEHDRNSGDPHPEGVRPADFAPPDDGGFAISDDFVARTFERVRADQARIADEAARVESFQFPRGLLDAFAVPPITDEFVARTAARVAEERLVTEAELRRLLAAHDLPPTAPDFVRRTFDALRVDRSALRLVRSDAPAAHRDPDSSSAAPPSARTARRAPRGRRAAWATAAVVVIAFGVWLTIRDDGAAPAIGPELHAAAAQEFSPARWNTALARTDELDADGVLFEAPDGLLLLAAVSRRGE